MSNVLTLSPPSSHLPLQEEQERASALQNQVEHLKRQLSRESDALDKERNAASLEREKSETEREKLKEVRWLLSWPVVFPIPHRNPAARIWQNTKP